MDNKPYFSIIVPVYNTNESYLKASIDSVFKQSFRDYELIIVNDSSNIEYDIDYSNIKYIKNEINKGTLYARKIGALNSNGKYILYLDSDDKLEINALKTIYDCININKNNKENKEYDIIHFGVKAISSNTNKKERIAEEKFATWYLSSKRSVINENYLFNETLNEKLPHNMCGKAFRSEVLKEALQYLPDSHLIHSEDMLQCLITMYFANSYIAINEELYIYNNDAGFSNKEASKLSAERFEKICLDTKVSLNEFYNFLKVKNLKVLHYYDYIKLSFKQYKYLLNKVNNEEKYLNILNKYFDNRLIEEYERFERVHKYYLLPLEIEEEIKKKLSPYFFSIIIYGYYTNIRIFGISITIKNNKCRRKPIVISFSNILRALFSISSSSKEIVLSLLGLKFYFMKRTEYGG